MVTVRERPKEVITELPFPDSRGKSSPKPPKAHRLFHTATTQFGALPKANILLHGVSTKAYDTPAAAVLEGHFNFTLPISEKFGDDETACFSCLTFVLISCDLSYLRCSLGSL